MLGGQHVSDSSACRCQFSVRLSSGLAGPGTLLGSDVLLPAQLQIHGMGVSLQCHICAVQYRQAQACGMLLGEREGSINFCLELRNVVVLVCDVSLSAL